jgi:hypothetical protein
MTIMTSEKSYQNLSNNLAKNSVQFVFAIVLVAFAVTMRFLPHLSNVTPIMAIALLSGFHFKNRSLAVFVPLFAMLASDFVIGFHVALWFVYLPILAVVFMGQWMSARTARLNRPVIWPVGESFKLTVLGSILFFLVSNFGVWETQNFYAHNFAGLLTCFAAGIPFFEKSLLGDMMFTGLVFLVYAVACQKFANLNSKVEFHHGR